MFAVISRSSAAKTVETAEDSSLQRSRGALDLVFSSRDGVSYASRAYQQGALKVRFPNVVRGCPPEAVVLNTAGGLTGGDRLDLKIHAEAGTAATLTSQACEKIYRSPGQPAQVTVDLSLDAGAAIDWLPQPAIFFDGAHLRRETRVVMASDARLLALEGIVFGRAAMGETIGAGSLSDSWTIRRDGRLIHLDRFDTGELIGAALGRMTVLGGRCAMATLRYVAPDAQTRLDEMRALLEEASCAAAASAWDGIMVVRMAASDSYGLIGELVRVLGAFRAAPLPRVWSI